jgi:hypothetical protein
MGWYDDRILPKLVDLSCGTKPNQKQREKVAPLATGRHPILGNCDATSGQTKHDN